MTARETIARHTVTAEIWDLMSERERDFWRGEADKYLAALDAAGLAVVPKEPTEAMCVAGVMAMEGRAANTATTAVIYGQPKAIYRAMIAKGQA
jgi:hypothetical protein